MRLVFLGPPGVGKGTQSAIIAKKHAIPHIATGDILRKAILDKTDVGLKAKAYIDSGKLVPDDVIIQVMSDRLQESDAHRGYVLDGYPRTIAQGDALFDFLLSSGNRLNQVIYLDLDEKVLVERISGRRVCPSCDTVYHLTHNKPEKDGKCVCGDKLVQRKDDYESTVRNRLSVYKEETTPLIAYYRKQNLLSELDAKGSLSMVNKKIEVLLSSCSAI